MLDNAFIEFDETKNFDDTINKLNEAFWPIFNDTLNIFDDTFNKFDDTFNEFRWRFDKF